MRLGQVQNEFTADDGTKASSHTLCLQTWVDATQALTRTDVGKNERR